jgi:hypothetical protein
MHFLAGPRLGFVRTLGQPHAAVRVRLASRDLLQVDPEEKDPISILGPLTQWVALPERVRVQVVDEDNTIQVIRPSGVFMVTVDTIDPYHLLADVRRGL